jgi:hypothetical protein
MKQGHTHLLCANPADANAAPTLRPCRIRLDLQSTIEARIVGSLGGNITLYETCINDNTPKMNLHMEFPRKFNEKVYKTSSHRE